MELTSYYTSSVFIAILTIPGGERLFLRRCTHTGAYVAYVYTDYMSVKSCI